MAVEELGFPPFELLDLEQVLYLNFFDYFGFLNLS